MVRGSRYAVPEWLDPLLPDVSPPVRICLGRDADGVRTGLVARHPDGRAEALPPDIEQAYGLVSSVAGTNITFSKGVIKRYSQGGRAMLGRSIGCPVAGKPGYTTLLMSYTDADRVRGLEDAWSWFLSLDRRWRKHPTFSYSFAWLSSHPAFWIRGAGSLRPGDAGWSREELWSWQTDGYVPEVYVLPRKKARKAVVWLESGAHVPESEHWDQAAQTRYVVEGSFTERYYDVRLDASARTYEKAIRKLARRVDRYFDVDGAERSGVRHKLTKYEKTLRRRMRDVDVRDDAWPIVRVAFADAPGLGWYAGD